MVPDALSRLPRLDDEEQMRLVENDDTLEDISATHGEVALVISELIAEPSIQFVDGYKTDTKIRKSSASYNKKRRSVPRNTSMVSEKTWLALCAGRKWCQFVSIAAERVRE